MDFFNALSLDLKMLVVGIAGCALLALFSGNPRAEKRYIAVLAVLAAVGIYRFVHMPPAETSIADSTPPHFVKVKTQHTPLVSTFAK